MRNFFWIAEELNLHYDQEIFLNNAEKNSQ